MGNCSLADRRVNRLDNVETRGAGPNPPSRSNPNRRPLDAPCMLVCQVAGQDAFESTLDDTRFGSPLDEIRRNVLALLREHTFGSFSVTLPSFPCAKYALLARSMRSPPRNNLARYH